MCVYLWKCWILKSCFLHWFANILFMGGKCNLRFLHCCSTWSYSSSSIFVESSKSRYVLYWYLIIKYVHELIIKCMNYSVIYKFSHTEKTNTWKQERFVSPNFKRLLISEQRRVCERVLVYKATDGQC